MISYRIKKGYYICFSHDYAKIKIDLDDDLPLERTLTMYNVVMLVKSVFNRNKNHFCYNIFLEKGSHHSVK